MVSIEYIYFHKNVFGQVDIKPQGFGKTIPSSTSLKNYLHLELEID